VNPNGLSLFAQQNNRNEAGGSLLKYINKKLLFAIDFAWSMAINLMTCLLAEIA